MSAQKITVLMLGGGRRVSVAVLLKESGRHLGHEVEIVSYELTLQMPITIEGKVELGLPWNDPGVVDDVVRVATEYEASIILPMVSGAIEVAARCKPFLPDVYIPVCSAETALRTFDKVEAAQLFKEAGLPIPTTYTVLNAEVPVIAKPRKGSSSRGIRVFNNMDDLMHLENLENYILQEYIGNFEEFTVDSFVDKEGNILVSVPRRRIEVMGGESSRTETVCNEILTKMNRDVIETFQLRGPVDIQFLHDLDTDRYLLLEVNPRLASGVVCSIYAGAPITDYILQESLGVSLRPCTDWSPHTLMARYQKEVIFHNNRK